jgi:hypothetical protein
MKIFYSINENAKPVNFLKTEDNKVYLKLSNEQSIKDCLGMYEEGISFYLENATRLIYEHNIILVTSDSNNKLNRPVFKNVETNESKLSELDYFRFKFDKSSENKQNNFVHTVCKIYIPFKDSLFNDYLFRIQIKEEDVSKLLENFANAEEVSGNEEDIIEWNLNNLPRLKIVNTSEAGDWTKIKVQLTLNNDDVSKEGVRVFAKSSSGYIANREVYTDIDGIAEFKVLPYGLEQGEVMKVEFGFKYFSNIISKNITA